MGRKRRGGAAKGGEDADCTAAATSNPFEETPEPPRPVLSLSPDGRTVAAAYGRRILLLDVA